MESMIKRAAIVAAIAVAAVVGVALWQNKRDTEHHSRTLAESVRRVTKLATVEMNLSNWQLRSDSKPLLGFLPFDCEKTVAVFYRGKVAAGFDIAATPAAVHIAFDHSLKKVSVALPAPTILYIDVPAPELLIADGSLCNSLSPADYTRLHTDARNAVEAEALRAGVLGRAEAHARDLLAEVARPLGYVVELKVGTEGLPSPAPR